MTKTLEDRLGYRFKDPSWRDKALTHSSKSGSINNERIEFLGDRVLNLVVADMLFKAFPTESEGQLAKRHSALVQGKMLWTIANAISLGSDVILSDAERSSGGAANENILSDAMEALIGAVYLDGGLDHARDVITRLWGDVSNVTELHQDPKTELQEWVQARGLPLPEYEIVGRTGPDHAPVFEIEVRVQGYNPVMSEGTSRRQAEKTAAQKMLVILKESK